jgi:hypothetical protein
MIGDKYSLFDICCEYFAKLSGFCFAKGKAKMISQPCKNKNFGQEGACIESSNINGANYGQLRLHLSEHQGVRWPPSTLKLHALSRTPTNTLPTIVNIGAYPQWFHSPLPCIQHTTPSAKATALAAIKIQPAALCCP